LTTAICYIDIYTPSNTKYLERATMTNAVHDGLYYYDLAVPMEQGVYPIFALCYYQAGQSPNYATNFSVTNGTYDSGALSNTQVQDGTNMAFTETPVGLGNPRRLWLEFNTSGTVCSNISSSLLTGLTVYYTGRWNSNIGNDVITISLWNYTSSSWYDLPNTITGVGTGYKSVSNSLSFNNISINGLVNSTGGNLRVKFQDTNLTDGTSTGFDVDYLNVACDQLSNPQWQEVRGSSELHISSEKSYLIDMVDINLIPNASVYGGFIMINYTVESGTSTTSLEDIELSSFPSLFCPTTANQVLERNNVTNPIAYTVSYSGTIDPYCIIHVEDNLTKDGVNYYQIILQNTLTGDIESQYASSLTRYEIISDVCIGYGNYTGKPPYTIPLTSQPNSTDSFYNTCNHYLDLFNYYNISYWQTHNLLSSITNDTTMENFQAFKISTNEVANRLALIADKITQMMSISSDYSWVIINTASPSVFNTTTGIWANLSTSYRNYEFLNSTNNKIDAVNQTTMNYLFNLNSTIVNLNNMVMSSLAQISIDIGNIISNFTSGGSLFLQNIAKEVWGYSDRTLTDFNFTVNTTIDNQIISGFVWNNTDRTLTSFDNFDYSRPALFIWNSTDRQLTAFNFDTVNETVISDFVWNYTTRTLTDFDYQKNALYVWNSTSRTLTEINATNITGNVTIDWEALTGCSEGDLPRCVWQFFWMAGSVA